MSVNICEKCQGLCCRYIALPIETPSTRGDFDDVRWYLAHEGITVFVEDDDWYINIASRCKHLTRDNLCEIYAKRPRICRGYKDASCDYHSGDYGYEHYFSSIEELDEHIRRNGKCAKQ